MRRPCEGGRGLLLLLPLFGVAPFSLHFWVSRPPASGVMFISHHTCERLNLAALQSFVESVYCMNFQRLSDFSLMSFIFPLLLFSTSYRTQFSGGNPIPSFNNLITHIRLNHHPSWNPNFLLHPADAKLIVQHSLLWQPCGYILSSGQRKSGFWTGTVSCLFLLQQRMQTLFGHGCDVQLRGMCLPTTVGSWTTGF